jgi:LysR family nitrogen assimilation transcriptional regulator
MELRQLRYFVAIIDYASLSKAANHLFVAQPALSQHIRQMEDSLKVKLLHRMSRGVTPTEAGQRLYMHAKTILAQVAELADDVRDTAANPVGEVRFGMSGTVSELVSVPLIQAVRQHYPGIRIRPVEAMSGYVLDWLRRGEVDVALVYASTDPKGFAAHHVLTEELCLFGRKGARPLGAKPKAKLPLADVLTLDLITPGLSHGLRQLIEEAALNIRTPLMPTLEIDSYNQIKKLGLIGAGYGILPETAVAHEVKEGLLDRWGIVDPPLRRRIYLSYSNERPQSAAARAITQLAWSVTRRLVRDKEWAATLAPGSDKLDFS